VDERAINQRREESNARLKAATRTANNTLRRKQLWMLILRYFAGLMAWATIAIVNLGLLGCTLYCYYLSGRLATVGIDGWVDGWIGWIGGTDLDCFEIDG